MFAVLLSAVWTAIGWFARAIVFKGVLYIALFYFTSEAMQYFASVIQLDTQGLSGAFASLANGSGYFIQLFRLDVGVPAILSAFVLRFSIRRLPIIG